MITVKIIKVYPYRSARVNSAVTMPRHCFDFVREAMQPKDRDNHIVVHCKITDENRSDEVALWMSDFCAVVGTPDDIEVRGLLK